MERNDPIDITILHLDTVDSTNTYAKLHHSELADGTLVTVWYEVRHKRPSEVDYPPKGRAWVRCARWRFEE